MCLVAAVRDGHNLLIDISMCVSIFFVVFLVFHLGRVSVGGGCLAGHVLELALIVVVGRDPVGGHSSSYSAMHGGVHRFQLSYMDCCSSGPTHQVRCVALGIMG